MTLQMKYHEQYEQGRREGMEEGRTEGLLDAIIRLGRSRGDSPEQIISNIALIVGGSQPEAQKMYDSY